MKTAANAVSDMPVLSSHGRYVVFPSRATNLVTGGTDTNGTWDLFVFDHTAGTTALVSRTSASPTAAGNAVSGQPLLSGDGAYVAFASLATDLVAGGNPVDSVFLYDRAEATNTRVAGRPSLLPLGSFVGSSGFGSASADGRYVAFTSDAPRVLPGISDANGARDLFLLDRLTGTTSLVSHTSGSPATTANAASGAQVVLSADGSTLAFASMATDLVAGQVDSNHAQDVFLYDRRTGTTTLVSQAAGSPGVTANAESLPCSIAGDLAETITRPVGATVTYTVNATIDPGATGSLADTVQIAAPAGISDLEPTNDSATDIDSLGP